MSGRDGISQGAGLCLALALALLGGGCDEDKEFIKGDPEAASLFADVETEVHPEVATIIQVSWEQKEGAEQVRLKYRFEGDDWLWSRKQPAMPGRRQEVVLGVPAETDVIIQLAFDLGGREVLSDSFWATNGELPGSMPLPTVTDFDPSLASEHRWMLGAVEDTKDHEYYMGPFWVYIIDREGRVVWYYTDMSSNDIFGFPRITREQTHIGIEKRGFMGMDPNACIHLLTLDHAYSEVVQTPSLTDCWDFTDHGTVLYNTMVWEDINNDVIAEAQLVELDLQSGDLEEIFDVRQWAVDHGAETVDRPWVYSNTVNWDPASDTVLLSSPYYNTITRVHRPSGEVTAQWGGLPGSWAFEPDHWGFAFNHFPSITPDHTLLVSTHLPGETEEPSEEHRFAEFEIDEEQQVLREKWTFGEGVDVWPLYKGMAWRLDNGNTLVNFGTGGVIQEVTPQRQTAWRVVWDDGDSNESYGKMAGHNILIDDLYALCQGPQGTADRRAE